MYQLFLFKIKHTNSFFLWLNQKCNYPLDKFNVAVHSSFRDNIPTINGVEFEVYDTLSSKYDVHSQHEAEKSQVENLSERIIDERKQEMNHRPIIGILAQELSSSLEPWYGDNYTSYIGAAYVKYVEQAGARVVPVLINQDDDYYDTIFKSTNGLLIPGGAVSIVDSG